jgi:hypothetical protein
VTPPSRESACTVSLAAEHAASLAAARDALPDPATLEPGSLVVVLPALAGEKSLASSVLSAFGRKKIAPRAVRCSALVARGYVRVGAGVDPTTKEDLAWGYAAGR